MSLRVITPPVSELISVAEAAEFIRLDNYSSEQSTIETLIKAVRKSTEEYLRQAIGVQTLEVVLKSFPVRGRGVVLRPPVIDVTSVTYIDTSSESQPMDEEDYYIAEDAEPGMITPVETAWPATLAADDAVRVRYRAGYCAAGSSPVESVELPETIKIGMMMLIADLYENRTAQVETALVANKAVENLLSIYRLEMGI